MGAAFYHRTPRALAVRTESAVESVSGTLTTRADAGRSPADIAFHANRVPSRD